RTPFHCKSWQMLSLLDIVMTLSYSLMFSTEQPQVSLLCEAALRCEAREGATPALRFHTTNVKKQGRHIGLPLLRSE
ncbi:MAG: hypothetical protein KAV87_68125, partial [Desulfobacteraceae bacterium]|nr:hypothetical protein [Desulfobacteraceae bacterium]